MQTICWASTLYLRTLFKFFFSIFSNYCVTSRHPNGNICKFSKKFNFVQLKMYAWPKSIHNDLASGPSDDSIIWVYVAIRGIRYRLCCFILLPLQHSKAEWTTWIHFDKAVIEKRCKKVWETAHERWLRACILGCVCVDLICAMYKRYILVYALHYHWVCVQLFGIYRAVLRRTKRKHLIIPKFLRSRIQTSKPLRPKVLSPYIQNLKVKTLT